jgi:glycosyltransferase involved in cell wall biosynthesis
MKIFFYLTSRYPTHKAYGVTTGETARALRERNHQIEIYSPKYSKSSRELDAYGNLVVFLTSPGLNLGRKLFSNFHLIGPVVFTGTSILMTLKAIRILKRERPDVIWVRDYWSALLFQVFMPKVTLVQEVHHLPKFFGNRVLARLAKGERVALLPINESLKKKLNEQLPEAEIFLAPMGASKDFFAVGTKRLEKFSNRSGLNIKVCYLGRMKSSGVDNGIMQLIEDWREVPAGLASLTLIGLSKFEIEVITRKSNPENVTFESSVEHEDVPLNLAKFDCGLVPYPDDRYHQARFPIKLVEYCAAGLNILATDTIGNRELLGEGFCYFYEAGNPVTLRSALMRIRDEGSESKSRAIRGFLWAQNYTYSKRLIDVYPFLERCLR